MLSREEYGVYCKKFKSVYQFLLNYSLPVTEVVGCICALRGYDYERMLGPLKSAGFLYIKDGAVDYSKLDIPEFEELALFTKEGHFLLEGRYIFPVRDMLGNIIALIGWYPDEKKYITTPSRLFSKDGLFFGMEQLSKTGIGKDYILVEGIFDSISVRALGLPCIAQMGISSSRYKEVMYSFFRRIMAIPDNDNEGIKVLKGNKWSIPSSGKYLRWKGVPLKDIDDICKSYEEDDVRELLLDAWKEPDKIVTVQL